MNPGFARARIIARWVLAALYLAAGILHLVAPASFMPIMPDWVPFPWQVILATGACEVAGAAGLLIPKLRSADRGLPRSAPACGARRRPAGRPPPSPDPGSVRPSRLQRPSRPMSGLPPYKGGNAGQLALSRSSGRAAPVDSPATCARLTVRDTGFRRAKSMAGRRSGLAGPVRMPARRRMRPRRARRPGVRRRRRRRATGR